MQTTKLPSSEPTKAEKIKAAQAVLALITADPEKFRQFYADKPLTFLRTFDKKTKWPRKLRFIFAQIWTGKSGPNVIMKACRGGGKSRMLGSLGFALFFFKNRSVIDMGGALAQAKIVYNYFADIVYAEERILEALPDEPKMEYTTGVAGNYFRCVAASPKAVRGPHPDVLMADEVCETPDDLVLSALPMVDTSPHALRILTSTFHKTFGIFQETWDRAQELGYTRYAWDIFDVVKEFDLSVWDDETLNREIPDLQKLKALSEGRTGDPDGWIPIRNVIAAWRQKRSLDWFLTEYMGQRPSAEGLVNDPVQVDAAVFEEDELGARYAFTKGAEVVGGLDWGFSSMTAWCPFMRHQDDVKVAIKLRTYSQVLSDVIISDICDDVATYGIKAIRADSAGKFENAALRQELKKRNLKCVVIEVVFSKEKVDMLGNYRAHFQRGKIKIPKAHQLAIWQHKRYRYVEGTDKPAKEDDHIPDATMCALSYWPLGKSRANIGGTEDQGGGQSNLTAGLRDMKF